MRFRSIAGGLAVFFWLAAWAAVQVPETTVPAGLAKLPDHPRILLFKGEEATIAKAVESDPTWAAVHQTVMSECATMLEQPPVERILHGRRLLAQSRECLRRVFFLSYAWRMTGDQRYAKRAEEEMLAVSRWSDWNPSHFLDVAEMTMAVSLGYDWLHDSLPEQSLRLIREAIRNKGIDPSLEPRYSGWLNASQNWNQVCNAGMTYGALAIFEDHPELARSIINRAIRSIPLAMADYGPDGAYPEGCAYWGYGTSFNVMFLSAVEKVFGTDFGLTQIPGFMKTAGYLLNMTGPTREPFNYSDASGRGGPNPAMFWFASRLGDNSLLWTEKGYLSDRRLGRDRLAPATLIWGASRATLGSISPPGSTLWVGAGKNPVALMRTSWTDPKAIFVGIKGGSPSVNHGHMDIGSFVMEADAVRWAMDYGAQDYNSLESKGIDLWGRTQDSQRWRIFRYNNLVHNTLTLDGLLQRVSGFAPITRSSDGRRFKHAQLDMTAVYEGQLKKAHRGIAVVDEGYVLVRDELQTQDRETTLRWTLLTPAQVQLTGPNAAELTLKGRKLRLEVREPGDVRMKTWSTTSPNDYDAPNPGSALVGFEVVLPANTGVALTVFLVPESAGDKPLQQTVPLDQWP